MLGLIGYGLCFCDLIWVDRCGGCVGEFVVQWRLGSTDRVDEGDGRLGQV